MGLLEWVVPSLADVIHRDFWWMAWNTFLAWIPVALALVLFRGGRGDQGGRQGGEPGVAGDGDPAHPSRRTPRSPLWWAGLVLFALFLPNAPYVVTDLVHLRHDVLLAAHDGAVVTSVLPVYAVFIGSGFLAYYLALAGACRYLARIGLAAWQGRITILAHAVCAVGIFLGRWARLNSWEPVLDPHGTLERIMLHLTWSWAPPLILATFLATWMGHFMTKAITEATWHATLRNTRRLHRPRTS